MEEARREPKGEQRCRIIGEDPEVVPGESWKVWKSEYTRRSAPVGLPLQPQARGKADEGSGTAGKDHTTVQSHD